MARAARKQNAATKKYLLEAWGDLIDPRDFYQDDYGNPFAPSLGAGFLGYNNAREHGDNAPFFRSEKELQAIRDQARWLAGINLTGVTILERLTDYAVGVGYETTVAPINGASKDLATAALKHLDQFAELNGWHGDLDRELFARSRRDGEYFLALYACDEQTECRIIEPDFIHEPANARELETFFGIDDPIDWKFGIATPADDIQKTLGYHVQWSPGKPQDFDLFAACDLEHCKVNVDRNIKRGLSDYYPAIKRLMRSDNLLTNIIESTTAQAAIAFVEQNPDGTTKAAAEAGRALKADNVRTQYTPGGSTRSVYQQRLNPATILRPQPGKVYIPGPGTEFSDMQLGVLQAALRMIGSRWGMPEHMISGDASNNNYASIVEAGAPFARSIKHKQHICTQRFRAVFWKVLRNGYECGVFSRWVQSFEELKASIEITLTPPALESQDEIQETERNAKLNAAGILSDDTWSAREGLDREEEVNKGAKRQDVALSAAIGMTPSQADLPPSGTPGGKSMDAPADSPAPLLSASELAAVKQLLAGKSEPVTEAEDNRPSWLRRFWKGY